MPQTAEPRTALVSRALNMARAANVPYMVAELDHEDTRRQSVHPYSYANYDEFYAFDGKILVIGYPDGSTD